MVDRHIDDSEIIDQFYAEEEKLEKPIADSQE